MPVRRKPRLRPARALAEELDGVGLRKRRHLVFLLAGDPKRSAARHEELEVWAASEQGRNVVRAAEDLLQVVEQKE